MAKKIQKRYMVKFFMDNGQEIVVNTPMEPETIDEYYAGFKRQFYGLDNRYRSVQDPLPMMIFGEARIPRSKIQSYFIAEQKEMWDYDDPLN